MQSPQSINCAQELVYQRGCTTDVHYFFYGTKCYLAHDGTLSAMDFTHQLWFCGVLIHHNMVSTLQIMHEL